MHSQWGLCGQTIKPALVMIKIICPRCNISKIGVKTLPECYEDAGGMGGFGPIIYTQGFEQSMKSRAYICQTSGCGFMITEYRVWAETQKVDEDSATMIITS